MSNKKPEIPTISTPTPFKVEFGEAAISDLRARLQNARFGTEGILPAEEAFSMELHPKLSTLKEWTKEWEHLDFQKFEDDLNRFEHFTTKIDWCNLHFVHLRSSRSDAIPLMLLHGWPGSFYEFHHMIESLAEPNDPDLPAFHVVVPSLPGYCWSSPPPSRATSGVDSYSRILNALMFGLGYSKYATNGGDWGSPHSRVLGAKFSFEDGSGCRAVHLNFCPCGPAENAFTKLARLLPNSVLLSLASWTLSEEARLSLSKSLAFSTKSMAYYNIQGTRPAQLSASLIDSPVGLLSWIGHFFVAMGSSPTMTLDSVLKDVSLYWFTGCIGTSFLVYGTNPLLSELHKDPKNFIKVPFGYSGFPKELTGIVPSNWVQNTGNLRWYAKSPAGGHFAALEQPKIFVEHLRSAFSKKGKSKNFDSASEIVKDGAVIKGGLWDEERALEERKSKL